MIVPDTLIAARCRDASRPVPDHKSTGLYVCRDAPDQVVVAAGSDPRHRGKLRSAQAGEAKGDARLTSRARVGDGVLSFFAGCDTLPGRLEETGMVWTSR